MFAIMLPPSVQFRISPIRPSNLSHIQHRAFGVQCYLSSPSSERSSHHQNNKGKRGYTHNSRSSSRFKKNRFRRPPPIPPGPGEQGQQCHRSCIKIGSEVYIVKKNDQKSGKLTKGVVSRLLTRSGYHPRGIKVMFSDGTVGRVARISAETSKDENPMANAQISLSDYLKRNEVDDDLTQILLAASNSSSRVAAELRMLPFSNYDSGKGVGNINVQGEEQKGMDVRANDIFIRQLKPLVAYIVSEEEESIVLGSGKEYSVALDPLDGSSNLDINAPTGSIFAIYRPKSNDQNPFELPTRQTLVAAGYALYSSATELVIAGVGDNTVGFALDNNIFRLSNTKITCPERGPYYSLNEAREPDWPDGLRRWISDAKRGQTPSGMKYSSRYVCSLTADVHRTLLKGGWAGNPRPHLRLLYEAAPLAFISERSGGAASDGVVDLLDIQPTSLHQRVCCFIGSKLDIKDLKLYGDVQQKKNSYLA